MWVSEENVLRCGLQWDSTSLWILISLYLLANTVEYLPYGEEKQAWEIQNYPVYKKMKKVYEKHLPLIIHVK